MTKLKLTYFDSPTSRGEECRLALFIAGSNSRIHRIKRSEWPALKPNTRWQSTTIESGKACCQPSKCDLGTIGRHYGLLPKVD
jgi:hypothetical protein